MTTELVKCPECEEDVIKHNCEIKCSNCGFFQCCHDIY